MNFGFLLLHDLEELDLIGPWEMFNVWSQMENGPEQFYMEYYPNNIRYGQAHLSEKAPKYLKD